MLGSPVTPPALGAGELASSNLAISTKNFQYVKYFNYLCTMNANIKKYGIIAAIILWFALVVTVAITLTSCGKPKPVIEPGDVVKKIVINQVIVDRKSTRLNSSHT